MQEDNARQALRLALDQGWTLEQLGHMADVHPKTLRRFLNGGGASQDTISGVQYLRTRLMLPTNRAA